MDNSDNSDSKESLKQQKSPETTTDTRGMSKFLLILRVKYSYFEIFIVVNRPYFVPYTIPNNVFKFSTVRNTESHNAWRVYELIVGFFWRRELGPPMDTAILWSNFEPLLKTAWL